MRASGRPRRSLPALLALAVVAACAPASPTPPIATPRPTGTPASPGATASPSATPAGSPSPTAAASATPLPPASASPSPLPGPTASAGGLRGLIAGKLLTLARVAFTQNRGQLASEGAKLLGDAGGALIGNNGAGIIGNHGGGLVTDNGAGYRLAQAAMPVITTTAGPTERLVARRTWPAGFTSHRFHGTGTGDLLVTREVLTRGGVPFSEEREAELDQFPDGTTKTLRREATELLGGGRLAVRLVSLAVGTAGGGTATLALQPGSFVRDEATGAVIDIQELAFDLAAGTGTFRYAYTALGLVETGTLTGVKAGISGLLLAYWDPLAAYDGESRTTDAAGALVYTKRQRTEGGKKRRDYDLGDGVTLALAAESERRFTGAIAVAGAKQGDVVHEARADGSSVFTVTIAGDPEPLVIGYGLPGEGTVAPPSSPPQWIVLTQGGAVEPGFADGPADQARVAGPLALVASRKDPNRMFLADVGNHRVRALTRGPLAVSTVAGDGTAGHRDGPAAQARFQEPSGLAVGPDDTIYVADTADHRIRAIAPDGTVRTVAGDGTAGLVDGLGTAARFDHPLGLALDGAGRLYVADALNHAIRRIGPDGAVTTVAGGGGKGLADGAGAEARFNIPYGLTIGPDGALYVADRDNNRIRKVIDGQVTTVAGSSDPARLWLDGPALETRFNPPRFMAFGPDGLLYFTTGADLFTLSPAGVIGSYAGTGSPGDRDGVSHVARFRDATGLAFAPNGVLQVLDQHRLRAIVPPAAIGR